MSRSTEAEIKKGQERLKSHENEARLARETTREGNRKAIDAARGKLEEGRNLEPYREPASKADKEMKERLIAAGGGDPNEIAPPSDPEGSELEGGTPKFVTEVAPYVAGQPAPEPTPRPQPVPTPAPVLPRTEPPIPKQTATIAPAPEGSPPKGVKKAAPSLDDLLKS